MDLSFDISITGFEVPEIDLILHEEADDAPEDQIPAHSTVAITQPGDIWALGSHRVICGSCLDADTFNRLMNGRKAQMIFVDPPFNVRIDGHVCGNGAVHHREFAMASGEMSEEDFRDFLHKSLSALSRYSELGSVHFICMDWRHMRELLDAGRSVYDELLNLCVWDKGCGGMGSFYRSQHELIFVFRNGDVRHRNNVQLGKYGRNRTNVWRYPGINTLSRSGEEGNLQRLHPTIKPVTLIADAMLDCSKRGDLVLDSFLGSGSTLIAAEKLGRVCYGVELDPLYVDTAIRRWQQQTGRKAIHAESGEPFKDAEQEEVSLGK